MTQSLRLDSNRVGLYVTAADRKAGLSAGLLETRLNSRDEVQLEEAPTALNATS
jgi:hypothetical protein